MPLPLGYLEIDTMQVQIKYSAMAVGIYDFVSLNMYSYFFMRQWGSIPNLDKCKMFVEMTVQDWLDWVYHVTTGSVA